MKQRKTPLGLLAGAMILGSASSISIAQAPPGTDIWIFDYSPEGLDIGSGIQATSRPGYDNQPHFLPGGRLLLFTSIDETGQADIHSFDIQARTTGPLTNTAPESEYSATLMPSGDRISVIRVEADSTQRLWSFDLSGEHPEVLLQDLQPVGYHAWITEDELALFILGSPATLQIASVEKGRGTVAANDIGRSLYRVPGKETVSFVQWDGGGGGFITELDPENGQTEVLAPLLDGNEFYAWTPGGALLMGQGSKLFRFLPGSSTGWEVMADLSLVGIGGLSRVAVSPEGDRVAVVGVEG